MTLKKSQKSLKKWTKQKWRTKSGKPSAKTGERYLPEKAIKGLSNKEISEYLNNKNLKTFRTNDIYTPKLIWMTLKKYKIRLLRSKDNIIQIKECLYVTPINKNT